MARWSLFIVLIFLGWAAADTNAEDQEQDSPINPQSASSAGKALGRVYVDPESGKLTGPPQDAGLSGTQGEG